MYRNAAVTLGIEHANITIASPIRVTGESVLAGIYYSLEENGAKVPQENKNLAQQELSTLSGINAENSGKNGYDPDKLNVALTDIKAAVAKGGSGLSKEEIQKIVDETLKNYGLKNAMTSDQISLIVNFAVNLSNSGIISNSHFTATLNSLKDSIVSKSGSTFKNINLNFDSAKAVETGKGIWQQIVEFFKSLIG
ncbi:Extracellular protein [Streptococcus pseudoporcinus]|uniref:Extracellular protein n=1 Tax=Streptococcus pseudoporcinus TaxID=361101 RepID=A0A4U9XM03_9STRE|nr:Extracellular protein [Streptococcus pseudoporcinus]VUC67196.1 Extracellular protein [Streptococcus pseudoporcinus]VUC98124.1 Extracellular protein [Streptococcus pseudoporcinus]VUC98515.1 Extracellular protein [Streptococcus pseudoporcinus]